MADININFESVLQAAGDLRTAGKNMHDGMEAFESQMTALQHDFKGYTSEQCSTFVTFLANEDSQMVADINEAANRLEGMANLLYMADRNASHGMHL